MGKNLNKFIFELLPPVKPEKFPQYMQQVEQLFEFSTKVSITSHPAVNCDGFDRSLRLARYIREKYVDCDIQLHLTCRDLNLFNVDEHLTRIIDCGIKDVLVITGDGYVAPPESEDDHKCSRFKHSTDLLKYMSLTGIGYKFSSVSVAGYPNCSDRSKHLTELSKKLLWKPNQVITQCVFDAQTYETYKLDCEALPVWDKQIDTVVPSIAIFDNLISLQRFSKVARVEELSQSIIKQLESSKDQREFAINFLVDLCKKLTLNGNSLHICSLNKFETTMKVLDRVFN